MQWRIKHIFNLAPERPWQHGFVNFGFHGREGTQYFLHYNEHWLGCITAEDEFVWTAGAVDKGLSPNHIPFAVKHPHYVCELPDGSLLVSSNGTNEIFRGWPLQSGRAGKQGRQQTEHKQRPWRCGKRCCVHVNA